MVAKTLESEGFPCASMTAIPASQQAFRTPRVVVGVSIMHLLGDPALPAAEELALRRRLVRLALDALCAEPGIHRLS